MKVTDADFENVDPGQERTYVPPGQYRARFVSHEFRPFNFKGVSVEKLIVSWEVFTSPVCTKGVILQRFYPIERNRSNQLKFGPLCAFRKDWVAANDGRRPIDARKLPLTKFSEMDCIVEVVTVTSDSTGRAIKGLEWSRIKAVIGPVKDDQAASRRTIA